MRIDKFLFFVRLVKTRTLAQKLTSSFRQTVSVVRVVPVRAEVDAPSFALPIREATSGVRTDFSPFQFRLPPPTV